MKGSVVVIGSGPAGVEMRGADVDQHVVVRMWNHEWQPVERYGSRFDYGLITTTQDAKDAPRLPMKEWLFYNVPNEHPVSEINGGRVVMLEHKPWFRRAMESGAETESGRALKFTRGFAAAAGAIQHLKPRRVIVIGMNILRDGATGSKYYDPAALPWYVKRYPKLAVARPAWATDELPAGLRSEGPHDYRVEAALIRELAAAAGTELLWELP